MSKYLWYSGATDVTGIALAEALEIESGKTKPVNKDIIVGWGTKVDRNVDLGNTATLNHPNAINKSRDKLGALRMLKADRNTTGSIANFYPSDGIVRLIEQENVPLPLIGRKRRHQGGKGLWICLVKDHVKKAIEDGADYFQVYIDIKVEYRLHVFNSNIIYAVKKVENPTEAGWVTQRREKIQEYANKNNVNLDGTTVECVLRRLVKEAILPDQIIRSNTRGWKFSGVALNTVPTPLKNAAIRAVQVIGLDFGAVDCAINAGGHSFIIEVNTGPGLQGTSFDKYVTAFREKLNELENPQPNVARRVVNRVQRAVGANNADQAAVNDGAMVHMMNAVNSPEEARRVLDIAMGRG